VPPTQQPYPQQPYPQQPYPQQPYPQQPYPQQPYPQQPYPQQPYPQQPVQHGMTAPARPMLATVAAVIWLATGGVGALLSLVQLLQGAIFFLFVVLFYLVFVLVGVQTLLGKAKDTLGNAIGSLLFGLLGAVWYGHSLLTAGGVLGGVFLVLFLMGVLQGLALIAAGVAALLARTAYVAWFRSKPA
jgi:hypothetical protein